MCVSVNWRCVPLRDVRVFSPSCIPGRGDPTQMDVGSSHAGAASALTSMKSHGQDQVHPKKKKPARGRRSGAAGACDRRERVTGSVAATVRLTAADNVIYQSHRFVLNV